MLANILYILPMLLGRTFDARNDRVGIDIFPQSELSKARTYPEPDSVSKYEVTETSEEVRNLLEVSADLALKVKAGKLDLKGTGSYLKDTSKTGKVIEILTRLKFTTETVALPPDVTPIAGWSLKNKKDLGTHFVRSITYGGELLASIRFKANEEQDYGSISLEVQNDFSGGDAASLVAEGKLEKLQSRLREKASMEISYYATVPLKGVPNTIDGLRNLVTDFGKHVTEVNGGKGVPIRVELMELSSLSGANSSDFSFLKDSALENELSDLENEFDDLRKSQIVLTNWYRSLPISIDSEDEKRISSLYTRIQNVLRSYYDVIGKLNIEAGPDEQLEPARTAYEEGKSALPGKFFKEVSKLQRNIVIHNKKMYGTGTTTYVRWGSKECPKSPMIFQLETGYVSSSINKGTGGGSDYLCLPEKPDKQDTQPSFDDEYKSFLAGAKYGLLDDHPFENNDVRNFYMKGIPCSLCHLTNRTLVHAFPAKTECPEDWIYEYSGYMMSGSNLPGTNICVDEKPESYEKPSQETNSNSLTLVHVPENDFGISKPPYVKKGVFKCVVCSK
ncbi:uncharacterized protein LOC129222686 [Uloborus diversus]|uniref:uncharacterized protein LOC129222686 n=1 Tax=Uloborus diversus TaxID=327109 RepID=UPI00240A2B9E|nr:uncharacterized protein LOC129222686 [Uloborus diversus]